jgi:hypothetical protein
MDKTAQLIAMSCFAVMLYAGIIRADGTMLILSSLGVFSIVLAKWSDDFATYQKKHKQAE